MKVRIAVQKKAAAGVLLTAVNAAGALLVRLEKPRV